MNEGAVRLVEHPHADSVEAVVSALRVDAAVGLSVEEAARRLAEFGPQEIRRHPVQPAWRILLDQFRSLIIALLGVATAVAFLFGEHLEAWAILVVIGVSVGIGFATERQAVRSMEALFALGRVTTRVRRGGRVEHVSAESVVPGDVVLIEAGDIVSADLRVIEASKLQADESALTGESVPVEKRSVPVGVDAPLAERASMLYRGTAVTRGVGLGVVTASGMLTELGEISALVEEATGGSSPLEIRLDKLGRALIGITLGVAAVVTTVGVLADRDLFLMIETGIALAVAAVPEGLPVVATIALARGVRRMAERNALLRRLSAVETLGSTDVILTDKTGTLTENRMTVTRLVTNACRADVTGEALELSGEIVDDGRVLDMEEVSDRTREIRRLIELSVLCNDATLDSTDGDLRVTGDPMEVALLVLGAKVGMRRESLLNRLPEVREEAFDPEFKMMATVHQTGDEFLVAVKGAPGTVIDACTHEADGYGARVPLSADERTNWLERNRVMAGEGMRVIALASTTRPAAEGNPYQGLELIGLVGLKDPPREGVREAIEACRRAHVDVVMATGDQAATALGIARAVGLADHGERIITGPELESFAADDPDARARVAATRVFARVTPKQKLDLIALHQAAGRIVAMTGDGVNDAPALKKADIGVAMGRRGTQIAREAADMVLRDDAFGTIVEAIREGRVIAGNVRRFVFYLLSCNVSEVMVVALATALGMTLPLLPLQILFLNLVTDVFPALALGMGRGDAAVMQQRPVGAATPVINRRAWAGIGAYGLVITAVVLGALWVAQTRLGMGDAEAVTISFLTLAFAQLWHVFNMRDADSHPISNEITRNPWIWGALVLCALLIVGSLYVGPVAAALNVTQPSIVGWAVIIGASALPLGAGEAWRFGRARRGTP